VCVQCGGMANGTRAGEARGAIVQRRCPPEEGAAALVLRCNRREAARCLADDVEPTTAALR
jgi:hypothetical protein